MGITVSFSGDHPVDLLIAIKDWAVVMAGLEKGKSLEAVKASISANTPAADAAPQPVNPTPAATPVQPAPAAVIAQPTPITSVNAPAPTYQQQAPVYQQPAPVYQQPTPLPVPQAPTAAAPAFTYEQVGSAGAALVGADPSKMGAAMALMQKYGVQQVTDLKPDQLAPFALELRGLGAKI